MSLRVDEDRARALRRAWKVGGAGAAWTALARAEGLPIDRAGDPDLFAAPGGLSTFAVAAARALLRSVDGGASTRELGVAGARARLAVLRAAANDARWADDRLVDEFWHAAGEREPAAPRASSAPLPAEACEECGGGAGTAHRFGCSRSLP